MTLESNKNEQVSKKFPLRNIYFYLTEGCNLACRHCWLAPKHQGNGHEYQMMDVELFESIIRQALPLGLRSVKLTGGEPFMHPRILDILEIIRREDLKLVIESNGVLLTREIVEAVMRCKKSFVSVSLDSSDAGVHDEIRGVRDSHQKATAAVKLLAEAGLKPQIIMTLMRKNVSQIESLLKLAESLGAKSVKFNVVQPVLRGEKLHEDKAVLSIEELIQLSRWILGDLTKQYSLKICFSMPKGLLPFSIMTNKEKVLSGNCAVYSLMGVLPNGSYALCGIGESIPEMVFGHAASDSLAEVWNNTPLLKQIRENLHNDLKGVCASCIFKKHCLGCCVAQNYYRNKDIFAPYWICEEAHKAGLFPASRLTDVSA